MPYTVDFIRHAQSEFNIGNDMLDSPLSAVGRQQASQLTGEYDLVITSPLYRARQTLGLSKIKTPEHIVSSLCREYMDGPQCNYMLYEPHVKETVQDVLHRVDKFKVLLRNLIQVYPRILVISHGYFIVYFTKKFDGIGNCQLVTCKFD